MSDGRPSHYPILCIDFDGVIHSYEEGWKDGSIYGSLVPGFLDWAKHARKWFQLVIYSSRSKDMLGPHMMASWISAEAGKAGWHTTDFPSPGHSDTMRLLQANEAEVILLKFAAQKPAAFLTIDDRAVCFNGDWSDPAFNPSTLVAFKPWNWTAPPQPVPADDAGSPR